MKITTQNILRHRYASRLALICASALLLQLSVIETAWGETVVSSLSISSVGPLTTVTLTANQKGPDYSVSPEKDGSVLKVDLKDTDWHVIQRAAMAGVVTNYSVRPNAQGEFDLLLNVKSGTHQAGTSSWEGSGPYTYKIKLTDGPAGSVPSDTPSPGPAPVPTPVATPVAPIVAGDPDAAKADAIRARHQMKQQQAQRDASSKWQDVSADVAVGGALQASAAPASGSADASSKPATPMQIWEKSLGEAEGKDLAAEAAKDAQKAEEKEKIQEQIETFDETVTYESNMHSFLDKIGLGSGTASPHSFEEGTQDKSFADGFYFGLQGGLEEGLMRQTMTTPVTSVTLDGGANAWRGGVFGGWGRTWRNLYYGGEFVFYPGSVSHVRKYHSNNGNAATSTSTESIKNSWAIAARLGALASPTSLFYSKIGLTSGTLSHSTSDNLDLFSTPGNNSRTITGLTLGLGSEVRLAPHVTGRVDMNYNHYGKFNNTASTYSTNYNYGNNQYNIGFSYHLGDEVDDSLGEVNTAALEPEFFVGFGVGGKSGSIGHEVTWEGTPGMFQYDANNLGAGMQLYLGYGQPLGRFYVGGEVSYSPLAYTFNRSMNIVGSLSNTTEHLRHLFVTSARLGYYVSQDTMVYGRLGWSTGAFTAASSPSSTLYIMPDTFKQRLNGLAVGGGVETAISKHMKLRSDLVHTIYPTLSRTTINPQLGGGASQRTKYTPQNTAFNVGVSFAFGPGGYWPAHEGA